MVLFSLTSLRKVFFSFVSGSAKNPDHNQGGHYFYMVYSEGIALVVCLGRGVSYALYGK